MSGSLYGANTSGIQAALPPPQQQWQSPLAQLGAIQTIRNQQAALLNTQANTAQTNQTLNVNRMNRQAQVAMGLYDLPDSQLAGGQPIRDALGAELRAGTIDQNTYNQYLSTLPPATDENGNPTSADAFRQNIRSHIISTMTAPDAVRLGVGTPTSVDYGPGVQPGMQSGPLSSTPGAFVPQGNPLLKGLTPGEGAQRETGPPNPNTGAPTTVPLQSITPAPPYVGAPQPPLGGFTRNNPPPVSTVSPPPPADAGGAKPPAQPGAIPVAPGTPAPANGGPATPAMGGNTPAGGANTPAVTSTPPPASAPAPQAQPAPANAPAAIPGQVTTGLPPSFEDSRKMGQALTSRAENYTQNKGNYQTLLTDLQGINTGPGADRQQHIAAFFQKWAGSPLIAGLTSDDLARGEGFNKVATQISLAQGEQLGGTDQIQRATASATPNLSLSTAGNTQIIHKLLGNEDAINEKRNAWNAWSESPGHGQGDYNNFSQWWNKNVDLRSFQVPYMDQGPNSERAATLNFPRTNQGQQQAKEFLRRNDLVANAQKNGWQSVIPGGQPQQGQ